jgi:CcmD family protein
MAYLFGAYLILWAITFGYVFAISARQKQLQRDLERLQESAQQSPVSDL